MLDSAYLVDKMGARDERLAERMLNMATTFKVDREFVRGQIIRDLVAAEVCGRTKEVARLKEELRKFDLKVEVVSNLESRKGLKG